MPLLYLALFSAIILSMGQNKRSQPACAVCSGARYTNDSTTGIYKYLLTYLLLSELLQIRLSVPVQIIDWEDASLKRTFSLRLVNRVSSLDTYRVSQKSDTVLVFEFPPLLDALYIYLFIYLCICIFFVYSVLTYHLRATARSAKREL